LTLAFLGFSVQAWAQTGHGVGIQKQCETAPRVCSVDNEDTVCPDTDACNPRECDESIEDQLICTWTISHNDTFGDTITLHQSFDVIDPLLGGLQIRSPAAGNAEITFVNGNTTCTIGGALPCQIGPDQGGGIGSVVFTDDSFIPSDYVGLPDPLVDQANVQVQDSCDQAGVGGGGCNTNLNFVQFTAQTDLVDGCIDGTPPDCDDGDVCTTDVCDPIDGCVNTPGALDCDDNDVCTTDVCDPIDGCVNTPGALDCDDGDECTIDSCDPIEGCVHEADPACGGEAICRTPGFWATHAGTEKNRSTNITQEVIDSVGGLNVCGTQITNTVAGNSMSAVEAMCVAVKGDTQRQLVRQLTAAALNCVMSGGDSDCVGGPIEELFADCNDACQGFASDLSMNECIGQIDCFNNGGFWADGHCTFNPGACSLSGGLCDVDDDQCAGGVGDVCEPDPQESCHERELCQVDEFGDPIDDGLCYIPPGPAGSSGECNVAKKNDVYVP